MRQFKLDEQLSKCTFKPKIIKDYKHTDISKVNEPKNYKKSIERIRKVVNESEK